MHELMGAVLAATDGRGLDPSIVRPGWLALGIVALLGLALALLLVSFARHTRKAAQPWEGETPEDEVTQEPRAERQAPRD